MKYPLEMISDDDFEKLVNSICVEVLGTGVVSFAKGPDGGKDGKFEGVAQNYPSSTSPWSGKFIIQAKHTANTNASCSDNEFEKLLDQEIEKIKKIRLANGVDNYLLFTNRKYTGITGEALAKKIREATGIRNSCIIGYETICDLYLSKFPRIVRDFRLNILRFPIQFSEDDIREIIIGFKSQLPKIKPNNQPQDVSARFDTKYIDKDLKNEINGLSGSYYTEEILGRSLSEFGAIDAFLESPLNDEYKDLYFDAVSELRNAIRLMRPNFGAFEEVFWHIYSLVSVDDSQIKGGKRHILTFLHYMYMECLIGAKA